MVLIQLMAPVAGLDGAGVPKGKTDVRHQSGTNAAPVSQAYVGAHAGDAGNPLELADAAVMVNRPGAGHHGNERPPRQAVADLAGIGKPGSFQLKGPIIRCLPFKLDKGKEGKISQLRITADADTIAEPVIQGTCEKGMAAEKQIMGRPGIEIRGNLRRYAENQARLPPELVRRGHIQPNRVQLIHIHLARAFSVEPAQTKGGRGGKTPGTAGHPAQIQVRHPILYIHAPMSVSGIHGAKQLKIGLRGKNGLGGVLPRGSRRAIVASGISFRIIAGIITV